MEKRIVPSRDAVRVLRHLVYPTSAVFVGAAAAGACCLVHCETRRRVKLAEKIVDTKKTISSVANGRHKQRVTNMIEAAEKGESFLIDTVDDSRRPRRRRGYVTQATARPETTEDFIEDTPAAFSSRHQDIQPRRTLARSPVERRQASTDAPFAPFSVYQPYDSRPAEQTEAQSALVEEQEDLPDTSIDLPFSGWSEGSDPSWSFTQDDSVELLPDPSSSPDHIDSEKMPDHIDFRNIKASFIQYGPLTARAAGKFFADHRELGPVIRDKIIDRVTPWLKDNTDANWHKIMSMFHESIVYLPYEDSSVVRYLILQEHLKHENPRSDVLKVLERLYNHEVLDPQRWGQLFLNYYCFRQQSVKSLEDCVSMTQKIITVYREAGHTPQTYLISSVIRSLTNAGHPAEAEQIYNQLCNQFSLEFDPAVISIIVHGYATAKNWSRVDYIMSWLHSEGLSRLKPGDYTSIVAIAFREYAQHNTPEQSYDFLSYYIHTLGMIPTKVISFLAIETFIRHKRFKLTVDWLRLCQKIVPWRLDPSQHDTLDATIAEIWQQEDFSCKEILQTCEAMAMGLRQEPFSNSFRGITREAVSERLASAQKTIAAEFFDMQFRGIEISALSPFNLVVQSITETQQQLRIISTLTRLTTRQSLIAQQFLKACESVLSIDRLFKSGIVETAGHLRMQRSLEPDTRFGQEPQTTSVTAAANISDSLPLIIPPPELLSNPLPEIDILQGSMEEYYKAHLSQNPPLPPPHTFLENIVLRLKSNAQFVHGVKLLTSIHYNSELPSSYRSFPPSLLILWLQMSLKVKTFKHCVAVLWAILDCAETSFYISATITLYSRIASRVTVGGLEDYGRGKKAFRIDESQEMFYLKNRLQERAWREREREVRKAEQQMSIFLKESEPKDLTNNDASKLSSESDEIMPNDSVQDKAASGQEREESTNSTSADDEVRLLYDRPIGLEHNPAKARRKGGKDKSLSPSRMATMKDRPRIGRIRAT